jgi:hypothetical protein
MRTIRIQCDFCFKTLYENVEADELSIPKFGTIVNKTACSKCLDYAGTSLQLHLKENFKKENRWQNKYPDLGIKLPPKL